MTENTFKVYTQDSARKDLPLQEGPPETRILRELDSIVAAHADGTIKSPVVAGTDPQPVPLIRDKALTDELPMSPPPAATSPNSYLASETVPELLKQTTVDANTLSILANHYYYQKIEKMRPGLRPENFPTTLEARVYGHWQKLEDVNLAQGTKRTITDTVTSGMTISLEASMAGILGLAEGSLSTKASNVFGITVTISPQTEKETSTDYTADENATDTRFITWQQIITMGFYATEADAPFVWQGNYYGPHNYQNRLALFNGGPYIEKGSTHLDRFTFN